MTLLLYVLLGVGSALLLLALAGMAFHLIGTMRDWRAHPPPGRLVDVGGHRLHVYMEGEGRPPVVFDSALAGSCLSWSRLQNEIAKFSRTCSYDRAGMGWSDPGPEPRSIDRIADELQRLLRKINLPPPYVFVGHSYGALTALYFADRFREDVAALVLVDPPSPTQWATMTPEDRRKIALGARYSRHAALAARLGVARLISVLAD